MTPINENDLYGVCPICRGGGKEVGPRAYVDEVRQACRRCDGRGLVPIEYALLAEAVRSALLDVGLGDSRGEVTSAVIASIKGILR